MANGIGTRIEGNARWEVNGEEMLVDNGDIVEIANERDVPKYKINHRKCAGDLFLKRQIFHPSNFRLFS